jgi:glycosyltransferase involved in cell wall biosynthesis
MLSWEYPPRIVGGISRVVHDLAQQLSRKGDEIHVVTCWADGAAEKEHDGNVFVHRVHPYDINTDNIVDWVFQLNFALLEYSVRLINNNCRFDMIHAHDWVVAFAARALKYSYSIPLVCTIHATESGRNWGIHNNTQRYIHNVEWWLTYEAWRVIVNSEYMRKEVSDLFNVPSDKLAVIPNGIDLNKFDKYRRNEAFRRNYAMDDEKIVFFVGRLVNEKGAHILIDSIPKILANLNKVKFVISGKGPQMEFLKQKACDLKISGKIYFTGYINDEELCNLYKNSDMAVFPSLYEPFGIVALEGMVADLPVVVSDTGGFGDIVEHGVDGMKAYTGNANSLADSILELLCNPEKAEKIKKRAYEKVKHTYNWDVISEQIMDIYNDVIKESERIGWGINS